MSAPATREWRRTYAAVFVANLITAIGMMSFLPFFPSIVAKLNVDDPGERMLWSGLAFGAAPLAAAVMGPIWGSIGDRFGHKWMLMRALLAISIFVGAMSFVRTPLELFLLRLCQGVFSGFVPPSIALVSVMTPHGKQGRVTGTLQAALPAGMILGPLLGSAVQAHFGILSIFTFVALLSTLSALVVAIFVREDPNVVDTIERFSPTSVLANTLADLRRILAKPRVRGAIVLLFAVQFGMGATQPQLQIFVEEIWTGDVARIEPLTAWLSSAFAAAGLITTTLWGRVGDRFGHPLVMALAALGVALVVGATAAASTYGILLALRVAAGCTQPGANVAAFGIAATETPDGARGGAFAAVFSARALAVSFGSMAGGAISAWIGLRFLFLASSASILVVLVLVRTSSFLGANAARSDGD